MQQKKGRGFVRANVGRCSGILGGRIITQNMAVHHDTKWSALVYIFIFTLVSGLNRLGFCATGGFTSSCVLPTEGPPSWQRNATHADHSLRGTYYSTFTGSVACEPSLSDSAAIRFLAGCQFASVSFVHVCGGGRTSATPSSTRTSQ